MLKQQRKKQKELEKLDKVKIGYARVSSLDDRQKLSLEIQTEALKGCDILFSEKQSGSNDQVLTFIRTNKNTK